MWSRTTFTLAPVPKWRGGLDFLWYCTLHLLRGTLLAARRGKCKGHLCNCVRLVDISGAQYKCGKIPSQDEEQSNSIFAQGHSILKWFTSWASILEMGMRAQIILFLSSTHSQARCNLLATGVQVQLPDGGKDYGKRRQFHCTVALPSLRPLTHFLHLC